MSGSHVNPSSIAVVFDKPSITRLEWSDDQEHIFVDFHHAKPTNM